MPWPMLWAIGLILLLAPGYTLADESPVQDNFEDQPQVKTYDEAIIRFNTNIKKFASWAEFKAAIPAKASTGTCYALTNNSTNPVKVTTVELKITTSTDWKKTSGNGWRLHHKDRTFTEYRLNKKSGMLMRVEGAKPRFFFATNRRICEFPM